MTTRAEPLGIGPFTGGLNTYGDASTIGDDEVSELTNFDLDIDGSLKSRPPITIKSALGNSWSFRYLGNYTTFAGVTYLIFSNASAGLTSTYAYNPIADTWTAITTLYGATAIVTFASNVYLVAPPGSANPGGTWNGTTYTAIPTMPKGVSATIYKERMFVGSGLLAANPGRVTFSNPSNFSVWTGTDFFDVRNGDGQDIVKIYSFSGSIIIFKTNSTYVFAYESNPSKGQVQSISATLGLDGSDCMAEEENALYVMSGGDAYSISGWNWVQLNAKIPFAYVNAHTNFTNSNYSVSIMNNRVIFRYFDSYYVYSILLEAWSKWTSNLTPNRFAKFPIPDPSTGTYIYYGGNYLRDDGTIAPNKIFKMSDKYDAISKETFTCTLKTKTYSLDQPHSFKRLMWWGVDLLANAPVNAAVGPVTYGYPVKWKTIAALNLKWIDRAKYTWGAPLSLSLDVTDTANIKNFDGVRMLVKYIKSLRFRQVQFKLTSTVDGSTSTGPFCIFSIIAFVVNKQTVSKKIS